ncbi:MAG: hypothetical protein N2511_01825 [Thermodesulfovibrionales bacterium]|nr:hypothetical protein [Thermodesulfovibrionales bacterium]
MIKAIFKKNLSINIINILILLAIFFALLIFLKELLTHFYKSDYRRNLTPSNQKQQVTLNINDYETILKNNPFGIQELTLRLITSTENREIPTADIKLVGTVAGDDRYAYAIFQSRENFQETFKLGEKVFDYGILKKVEKNKAILKNDSKLIEIPLQEIIKIDNVSNLPHTTQSTTIAKSLTGGTFLVDKKKIIQAIDNPNELLTDARLHPNFIDGRQEGFILREVRNNGIYHNLGLQNGDILLKINDYSITNPESALQAFYSLRGLETIRVDIIRDGTRRTLTYIVK